MPELPDLTLFADSLQKLVLDRPITGASYHRRKRLNVSPAAFRGALTGRKIALVKRLGKELLFELDDGNRFAVNLVLAGGFAWYRKGEGPPSPILTIDFESEDVLALIDPQSFSIVTLNPDLTGRAVDALEVTAEYLEGICREKPKTLVKALLIDQKVIAGIGNAYSDEILWRARISPRSLTGKLPGEVVAQLARCIPEVLNEAVEYLRAHHAGLLSGEVRDFLLIHNSKVKITPTGHPITVEQIASKRTYYSEEQQLYS